MNTKTISLLICLILWTAHCVAQSDTISVLDDIEQKIEHTESTKDTSAWVAELIKGITMFETCGIEDRTLQFFGKLTTLPEQHLLSQQDAYKAYEAIAKIYVRKKAFFIATSYTERALKVAKHSPDSIRLLQQFCDILLLQKNKEDTPKIAKSLHQIDLLLQKTPNDTFFACHLWQQGALAELNEQHDKAVFLIEKAIPLFKANSNTTVLAQCYFLLSEAYQALDNNSKSLYFLQKYTAQKEQNTHKDNNLKDIYNLRIKDKALLLSVEKDKKQHKFFRFSIIGIACLLGILVCSWILFRYYKRQKQTQIANQNLNIRLMMNELKSFNYSVSHDLKAPLVEMFNMLSRIEKKEREKLNETSQTSLQHVSQTLLNTRKMIDEMLEYSITDNQDFEPQKFDMKELIEDILYQFSDTIQTKGVDVRVAPNFPKIYGDLAMIRQVFQNLISNGIKFSQNEPFPILQLDYKKEKNRIIFSVSDNGVGFDEQYKNKLFRLFQRLPTNEKFEGIGAGLAIVKRIVERHGGEVWAEGSVNNGAIFYFSLPRLS